MAVPMIAKALAVFSAISSSTTTELHTLAQYASPFSQTYLFEVFGNGASNWRVEIQGKVHPSGTYVAWDFIEVAVGGVSPLRRNPIEVRGSQSRFYLVWNAPQFLQLKATATSGTLTVYVSSTSQPSTQWLKTDADGNLQVIMSGVVSATIANLGQEGTEHQEGDKGLEALVVDEDGTHRAIRLVNGGIPVTATTPFPVSIDQPPKPPTFRVEIGVVAAGAGFAAELVPGGRSKLLVHAVYFSKPSVAITMRLLRNSGASTGGTSTNSPITPLDSALQPSGGTACKIFTGAPTAGAQVGSDLFEGVIGTGDVLYEEFGQNGQNPLVLRSSSETLAVNVSGAATIVGYIEFSEEAIG